MDIEEDNIPNWLTQDDDMTRFAATDQRIMYVDNDGRFKDIDFKHISSVEAERFEEDEEPSPLQMLFIGSILGAGVGLLSLIDGQIWGFLLLLAGLGTTGLIAVNVEDVKGLLEMEEKTSYIIRRSC